MRIILWFLILPGIIFFILYIAYALLSLIYRIIFRNHLTDMELYECYSNGIMDEHLDNCNKCLSRYAEIEQFYDTLD